MIVSRDNMHGLKSQPAARWSCVSTPPGRPSAALLAARPQRRRLQRVRVPQQGATASNGNGARIAVGTAAPVVNESASDSASGPTLGSLAAVEPESKAAGSAFTWTRNWWPLIPESYLHTDRPNAITLLGIPLVVWLDKTTSTAVSSGEATSETTTAAAAAAPVSSSGSSTWRVFRDRCPHRLAPLSEGRLEADGSLSCSYHGWRFDGSGACRKIPQAVDAAAEAAACASRRSCVTSFPVRLEANMLWVWPDDSPDAVEAAATAPVMMSSDIRQRDQLYRDYMKSGTASGTIPPGQVPYPVVWFMRDLPYSYEVLMENLTDPAHLPHSHHGVAPTLNRYKDAALPMQRAKPVDIPVAAASGDGPTASATAVAAVPFHWARASGPDIEYDYPGLMSQDSTISVTMPYSIVYSHRAPQFIVNTELFAVPVAPGRSRFFSIMQARASPSLPPLSKLASSPFAAVMYLTTKFDPVVFAHSMMNEILDGDSVFLAAQDEQLQDMEAHLGAAVTTPAATSSGRPVPADAHTTDSAAGIDGAGFWSRLYYLPAQCDSAVLAVRRWLEERAGGGPFRSRQRLLLAGPAAAAASAAAGPTLPPLGGPLVSTVPGESPSPQERVRRLDRYEQHTRHCPDCRTRLQKLQQLAGAARAVQTVAALGMCIAGGALGAAATTAMAATVSPVNPASSTVVAAAAMPWMGPVALLATLAALWVVARGLAALMDRLSKGFQFKDYVHAERN